MASPCEDEKNLQIECEQLWAELKGEFHQIYEILSTFKVIHL